MKSVTLVIRSGPTESLGTREMLDMALVLATFECPVSVILQNAGVCWASLPTMPDNSPLELSGKLKSLPLYDIDNVLIDENSCKERGIKVSDHFPGKLCKRDKILDRLNISDVVLEA
ncbi:MAG: DsrE family protein [Pseudomonadota bacterium]|nr:DsrE family protein [Pseudomonadota bacterium]